MKNFKLNALTGNFFRFIICAMVIILSNGMLHAAPRNSVSQFGITWTFDKAYETGQFVNGDWWVIGPVSIVSVYPVSGPADIALETGRTVYVAGFVNQWGGTPHRQDYRLRNGSMVDPQWKKTEGYDSGSATYDPSLSVVFPYTLNTMSSLISTVSHKTMPNPLIVYFPGTTAHPVLKSAAILTCLTSVPPADAFRPPYAGTWKPLYRASNLHRDLLPSLAPVQDTPSLTEVERLVERPWIDHMDGWECKQGICPSENMPTYGREYARAVSIVGLRLMLSDPLGSKEKLLIRFVQVGIDLYALQKMGAKWQDGGGITSGRKWPVVFAGILLDDAAMKDQPAISPFHEDQQTYYGKGWTGQTTLWQMVFHGKVAPLYEERHPETWTTMDKKSHSYRMHATGAAWTGQALGAMLLGGKQIWNHDAFFDYCDRWMSEGPDQFRQANVSALLEFMGKTHDPFVDNMYCTYRSKVPNQPGAKNNMKWVSGNWLPDSR
jgi:hypothetical protein